jgi:predicted permease
MSWWRRLWLRKKMEEELEKELRFHLDQHTADLIAQGLEPEEARRRARLALGGPEQVREQCRDARGTRWLEELLQDIRYGARILLKQPGFTLIAGLTVTVGIGANTAMFSVVNAVLLRPLPFPEPARLMFVEAKNPTSFAAPDFRDLVTQNRSFSHISAYTDATFNMSGGNEPERVNGARISAGLLPTLGVQPLLGRNLMVEEDRDGGDNVVLLSQGLWQRQFGADAGIVGRAIGLDEQSYTVIGVLPPGLNFPLDKELFVPLALNASDLSNYGGYFLSLIARLKPGVTLTQANTEVATIIKKSDEEGPRFESVRVIGLQEALVGDVRTMMLALMGAVGFVVLIACANLANLLLTVSARRQKEIAVRLSLGARRSRIVRQFLTESLLLAGLGGVSGLLLTWCGMALINAMLPIAIPRIGEIGVDGRVLWFTFALTVTAGLLFGSFPALRASQTVLTEVLKAGSRTLDGAFGSRRLRALLIVSQVALTVVLLTGAGLLIKSFVRLQQTPLGFRPERLLTARVTLRGSAYSMPPQRLSFAERLLEEVRRHPGMRDAALTSFLPFATGNQGFGIFMNDQEEIKPDMPVADFRSVSPEYFRVMGIPLLKGREFSSADHERTPMVAVINETMAKRYWPGADPIGQRIKETYFRAVWREIVGVVGSVRHSARGEEPRPEMFVPWNQVPAANLNLAVRTQAELAGFETALRRAVAAIDANLPVFEVRTMEDRLFESVARPRFQTVLLGVFASLALVMAVVGLYAVMVVSVVQRAHELGIRVALGAQRGDVIGLVLWQAMKLVGSGVVIGLAGAWTLTRILTTMLYEVKPTDSLTFLAVPVLLIAVAILACWLPARQAARIDPIIALRHE